ncbi:MAG: flagellar biosynthetic protein FliR [Nitrospiraceae bacterium]|nr:flagellar biosynthetic protein FliR [Nitrospiraceae bacterium]MDA8325812.1 flagellar biosynthetic protein FliR [Nitrospiraceae bacterium]
MEPVGINIFARYIPVFLLVLLRTSVAVAFLPFFSSSVFPKMFRIGFVVALAVVLTPVVNFAIPARSEIAGVILRETVLGAALGFAGRLVFFGIDMAAELISLSMGLSTATLLNPEIGQTTELTTFYTMFSMLVFLAVDAHHSIIYIFVKSFEWLPPGGANIARLTPALTAMAGKMFVLALRLSAPVVIAMFAINILLGFIYKAAPQMNVFFIGYPVYIFVGFMLLFIGLPAFVGVMGASFDSVKGDMIRILAAARG